MLAHCTEIAESIRTKLNEGSIKLPALPDTVLKVRKRMERDDYSAADIANIISEDSALSAVVLRMANSAYFNPGGNPVRNLPAAIQRIGTGAIVKLLISVASRMVCDVKHPELRSLVVKNHDHALLVAAGAERVAHISQAANASDAFMAGLLHDQGKDVLIMAIPEEMLELPDNERQLLIRMLHHEMGARLLHKWELPEDFVQVAQHHSQESLDRPRLPMLDCVDMAHVLLHAMQSGEDVTAEAAKHPAAKRLHLGEAQITGILVDIEDHIEELRIAMAA